MGDAIITEEVCPELKVPALGAAAQYLVGMNPIAAGYFGEIRRSARSALIGRGDFDRSPRCPSSWARHSRLPPGRAMLIEDNRAR
jgi:hypothetical protein